MNGEFLLRERGSLEIPDIKLILNHITEREESNGDSSSSDSNSDSVSPGVGGRTSMSPPNSVDSMHWVAKMTIDMTSNGMLLAIGGGEIGNGLILVLQRRAADQWRTLITLDHQTSSTGGDYVTAIQFISIGLTNHRYVIAAGYSSGTLRVFTMQGSLLLSQLLHNRPVQRIRAKHTPATPDSHDPLLTQELLLLYPDEVVACVSGVSLITILRVCIDQVARGEYAGGISGTNLSFRKWVLRAGAVKDLALCGPFLGSPFRALPYSTTEQSVTRLYAVGREPMLSVYYPSEDTGSSFSVAIGSVASKLTSAVFSYAKNWWSGGKPQQQQQQQPQLPKIEDPVPLSQRWSMVDSKREILSLSVDPTGRYAASTDNLGRILLIDLLNSIIVKIWKGYRDAQCGFIQTTHDSNEEFEVVEEDQEEEEEEIDENIEELIPKQFIKKSNLTSSGNVQNNQDNLYSKSHLVIYNGRRGILEIWGLKHQSREFFKNIGKGCKLISSCIPSSSQENMVSSECLSKSFIINPQGLIQEIVYK